MPDHPGGANSTTLQRRRPWVKPVIQEIALAAAEEVLRGRSGRLNPCAAAPRPAPAPADHPAS